MQLSLALIVNVRVFVQPALTSWKLHVNVTGPPQLSLAVICAFTLSQVGSVAMAGLQPRSTPCGQVRIVGALVSLTVIVCEQVFVMCEFVEMAVHVRVMVMLHGVPLVKVTWVAVTIAGMPQLSCAVTTLLVTAGTCARHW